MLKKKKEYFNKSAKQYRFLSKLCFIPMLIPVGSLIYIAIKDEVRMLSLIIDIVLFVAIYVGYMSLRIKADILDEISAAISSDDDGKREIPAD